VRFSKAASIGYFANAVTGAYAYMIKIGGAGGYGTEFIIDPEIMTDNLILSQEGRQSNADGFRLLSVPNSTHSIITTVLTERQ
jgi:hypothetical protein